MSNNRDTAITLPSNSLVTPDSIASVNYKNTPPAVKSLTEQVREFIRPFHNARSVYGWYGACDSTNLYFSLCSLYYAFIDAYENKQNILDPSAFSISNTEFHDAENDPWTFMVITACGLLFVNFAVMGSFVETDKNSYFVFRWMEYLLPYVRDVLKVIKWTFKGLRSALAVIVHLGASKAILIPLLCPLAALLGISAAANRIWLRSMRDNRKEMMRANGVLIDKIIVQRQVIHQLKKEPKSYHNYKNSMILLDDGDTKQLFYIDENSQKIEYENEANLEMFSNDLKEIQAKNLHALMKRYLQDLKCPEPTPNDIHVNPQHPNYIEGLKDFDNKLLHFYSGELNQEALQTSFLAGSYVYLTSSSSNINDNERLYYIDDTGQAKADPNSKAFHERYLALLESNDIMRITAEQLSTLDPVISFKKTYTDDNPSATFHLGQNYQTLMKSRYVSAYHLVKLTELSDQTWEEIEKHVPSDSSTIILCGDDFYYADREAKKFNKVILAIDQHHVEIQRLKSKFTHSYQQADQDALTLMTSIKGNTFRWLISDQPQWEQYIAFFAAAYSGFCDSLYFYMGTMLLAFFVPYIYMTLLLFSVSLIAICIIARINEENEYQRKHILTCILPQLELSKSTCIFLHEQLEVFGRENSPPRSSELTALIRTLEESRQKRQAASIPDNSGVAEQARAFNLLWDELKFAINERKQLLKDELEIQYKGSLYSVIGSGLMNGLAIQGVIASLMLALFTLSLVTSPGFILFCMTIGMVAILLSCIHSVNQNQEYIRKFDETKKSLKDTFELLEQNIKEDCNRKFDTEKLARMQDILTYMNSKVFEPSPEFAVLEWCEIFRLFFSGLPKGSKASLELFCNFLKRLGGSDVIPYISVGSALSFGLVLMSRYMAKTFAASKPSDTATNSQCMSAEEAIDYQDTRPINNPDQAPTSYGNNKHLHFSKTSPASSSESLLDLDTGRATSPSDTATNSQPMSAEEAPDYQETKPINNSDQVPTSYGNNKHLHFSQTAPASFSESLLDLDTECAASHTV